MGISLEKGGNANLSKTVPGLKKVSVGLGWDVRKTDGSAFDLDASVFLLNASDKCEKESNFIFYNNLKSPCGSTVHTGDNRTGVGDGDDEVIEVNLSKVPDDVKKLAFAVTIHDAVGRNQNFGMIQKAFIRVVNQDDNKEICKFDLSEDSSTETALVFGELYNHNGEWKFKAIGQGYAGGLEKLLKNYGLN